MAIAESAGQRFDMGRVVKRTLGVIGGNIVTLSVLSLLAGIPYLAVVWTTGQFEQSVRESPFDSSALVFLALSWLAYLIGSFLQQASITHATIAYLNGRPVSRADCLATAFSSVVQLVLIAVLLFLALIPSLLLLVIPAIMLMMMWIVAVPACVVERTGVLGSFGRSRELTSGYRWPIFWLYIVFAVVMIVVVVVAGAVIGVSVFAAAGEVPTSSLQMAIETIVTTISSTVFSALIASIYYELRQLKDGIGPEALASVFD